MPLLLLFLLLIPADAAVTIQIEDGAIVVRGFSPPAGAVSVHVDGKEDLPALAGAQRVEGAVLRFVPRFPLTPGLRYKAVYGDTAAVLSIPKQRQEPSTRVEQIFPSSDELPANLLKLYITFSQPMSRAEAWRRIHLIDDRTGREVANPFLEIEEELWDPGLRRLTVLFDPGRIKRGLVPHNEVGPALIEGQTYSIVVDGEWPDGNGVPMVAPYRKTFRVREADRTPPDMANWRLQTPLAVTRDPLAIDFPEPMDAALLERLLRVEGVEGSVSLAANEQRWLFTPAVPWQAGDYKVLVPAILEDLAGNRMGRKFDVDAFERVEMRMTVKNLHLPFTVRKP
jgi:hypothetical protein